MAISPSDNNQIWRAKTIDELLRLSCLEQAGEHLWSIRKFGQSATLAADVGQDIWRKGGTRSLPYTAGESVSIVSSSTADDLGGTGAQYLILSGLDTNYNVLSETIVMDGTTPVVSSNTTWITVDRAYVAIAGSGQKNAGNITITGGTSSQVHAYIAANDSITQQSHFTIPAGYTAFTIDTRYSVYRASGANASRNVELTQNVYTPASNTIYQSVKLGLSNNGENEFSPRLVSQTPAKSTLWFSGVADTNNTVVSTSVSYLMVKGDYNINAEF